MTQRKSLSPAPLRRSSSDSCLTSATLGWVSDESPKVDEKTYNTCESSYKVFVGSLPSFVNESFLFYYMSIFGRVKSVSLKRNLVTGHSRRYGYVKFYEPIKSIEIFSKSYFVGDKRIRIQPYQVNPCWKNDYVSSSGECTDEEVCDHCTFE